MPFFWNNEKWIWIENEFVIARKLLVQQRDIEQTSNNRFDSAMLDEAFKKYGAIESIELLENGKRNEAYVTFVSDASAHKAVIGMERSVKFYVRPADTWLQPSFAESPSIQKLNEDCLIAVLKQTDFRSNLQLVDTCKLLRRLLVQHIFPKVSSLRLWFPVMNIANVRKALRYVGPHIQKLTIDLLEDLHYEGVMQTLTECIGEKIRELTITDQRPSTKAKEFLILEPIFSRLQVLSIRVCEAFDLNVLAKCSNLLKLKIGAVQFGRIGEQSPVVPELNLEYLEVFFAETPSHENMLGEFVRQNPKLKTLKIFYHELNADICQNLSKLEKLALICNTYVNSNSNILLPLQTLGNLSKLTLSYISLSKTDAAEMFDLLKNLKQLVELKIYVGNNEGDKTMFAGYQPPLVSIARQLLRLEKFVMQGLTLVKSTIFDIVRYAEKLKSFHVHHCRILASDEEEAEKIHPSALIADIVLARKSLRNHKKSLELFIDPTVYKGLSEGSFEYGQNYVNIHCDCNHKKRIHDKEYGEVEAPEFNHEFSYIVDLYYYDNLEWKEIQTL